MSLPQQLISGYQTFASQRLPTEQSRYRTLSERGQSPEIMVIGCCDSRVSPEVIFDAGPGELFVMRYDGTDVEQLTDDQWEEGTPAWQPHIAAPSLAAASPSR